MHCSDIPIAICNKRPFSQLFKILNYLDYCSKFYPLTKFLSSYNTLRGRSQGVNLQIETITE